MSQRGQQCCWRSSRARELDGCPIESLSPSQQLSVFWFDVHTEGGSEEQRRVYHKVITFLISMINIPNAEARMHYGDEIS